MNDLPILIRNDKVFDAVSMATDKTSAVLDVGEAYTAYVFCVWTDAVTTGQISVWASNDGTNFISVAFAAMNSGESVQAISVTSIPYRYMQIRYTATTGSASLTCYVSAKR